MIVSTSPHSAPNSTPAATVNTVRGNGVIVTTACRSHEQHRGPRARRGDLGTHSGHAARPHRDDADDDRGEHGHRRGDQPPPPHVYQRYRPRSDDRREPSVTSPVPARHRGFGRQPPACAPPQRAQVRQQGPQRAGPVRRRVLLRRRQLGRRPRLPLRHEDRVVAEPVGARSGARASVPVHSPCTTRLGPAGHHERRRAHERRAASFVGDVGESAPSTSSRLARSAPWRPLHRADSTPGIPFSASTVRPESSATDGRPVAAAASRALARAFSANVAPVSGASGNSGTSASPTTASPSTSTSIRRSSTSLPGLRVARSTVASASR